METLVITVGIGGATSSGKTTLTRQLSGVLPGCTVIHQDSYWPNISDYLIHPLYHEPDAEDPRTAIRWPLFKADVKAIKATANSEAVEKGDVDGPLQDQHNSIEDLNFGKPSDQAVMEWARRFRELSEDYRARDIILKWFIVEGWHLYYDAEVIPELDVRILLRCPLNVIRQRRERRKYLIQDGSVWVDPPYYWEHFTYPAYLRTHSRLFHEGDVDSGPLSREAESENIILLDGEGTQRNLSGEDIFQQAAHEILLKYTRQIGEVLAYVLNKQSHLLVYSTYLIRRSTGSELRMAMPNGL